MMSVPSIVAKAGSRRHQPLLRMITSTSTSTATVSTDASSRCRTIVSSGDPAFSILGSSLHQQAPAAPHCQQQKRWMGRKAARMGQHLDSLDEQAHRGSRQEAKELRKQKKKGKKGGAEVVTGGGNDYDEIEDIDFEDDDDEDDNDDEDSDDDPLSLLPDPATVKEKMIKVVDRLERSFKSVRGAEATPELFDTITVTAYDVPTPLAGVAQVVIVSPTLANVTCFDPALATDVRNAIRDSLDLNPQLEDDGVVKVPLPRASMESRQKTVKALAKQAEAARARIRTVRRKAMDVIKKGKDGKLEGISKDDAFRVGKEIDVVADDVTKMVTDIAHEKEASVMAV